MTNCRWKAVETREDGATRYQCTKCKRSTAFTLTALGDIKANCVKKGDPKTPEQLLLDAVPERHRKYAGDHIADCLAAIGIPPCGGCESRKQWLNAFHRWLVG